MRSREPAVVITGTANTASVLAALRRLGTAPRLVNKPADIYSASHLVLPGVGAFGTAMERLAATGLVKPLRDRMRAGLPTLAICLGLQLMASESEESPGVSGLNIIASRVRRLNSGTRIPHIGWNRIVTNGNNGIIRDGFGYFANSYAVDVIPHGWSVSYSNHGANFIASLERGAVVACQFHPELSGTWGQEVIQRWLNTEDEAC